MSSFLAEQRFDEREQRYFLAEILKASSISPFYLFNLIQQHGIVPVWTEIALPNGRSASSCEREYERLTNQRPASFISEQPGIAHPYAPSLPKPKKRRPASGEFLQTPADRVIQPQHPNFAPVNEPADPGALRTSPSAPGAPTEYKGKKRGRPSNAEIQKRKEEAEARGEAWVPPKRTKTPRQSTEGATVAGVATPRATGSGEVDEGAPERKKARKPKPKSSPATHGLSVTSEEATRSLALDANKSAADQMQIDTPEHQNKSTIPETQESGFAASDSLLAQMRQHTAQTTQLQPDTVQSSMTLQQDSSSRPQSGMHPPASQT